MTRQLTATPGTTAEPTADPSAQPANDLDEAAATQFLADVLIGETNWSLGEVRDLLALHTLVGLGRWHAEGLHDTDGAAG